MRGRPWSGHTLGTWFPFAGRAPPRASGARPGRPEVGRAGRAALPGHRSGTVTVAEKAGRASFSCGTPRVRWRGSPESRSRPPRSAHRTTPPPAKNEPPGPAHDFRAGPGGGLVSPPDDTGRGFSSERPGILHPSRKDGSAPGVCFSFGGTNFFPSARDAFRFFPAASSEFQGRRHGSGVFQSRARPASFPSAGRRISAGGSILTDLPAAPVLSIPAGTTRTGPSWGAAAAAVRSWTTTRLWRPERRTRSASFRSQTGRSVVVMTMTARRLSLSSPVCLSVSARGCL